MPVLQCINSGVLKTRQQRMAKNTPAFQFYPSDFICGTMLLSLEATGAYIRILSVLWMESNLLSFCFSKLQTITQTTPEQFARLWPEIESKFVIEDGYISHPRFTHMMEISEKRRQSGSLGGRPSDRQESKTKASVKQSESKTQSKSEANSRRMKTEDNTKRNEYSADFLTFWDAFPPKRRTDKRKAFAEWQRAVVRADVDVIIAAAKDYARSDVGQSDYVKGPVPWLSHDCWEDDRSAWQRAGETHQASRYNQLTKD